MSVFINPLSYLHNGLFISLFRQDFKKFVSLVFRNSPKQQIVNVITAMSRVMKTGDGVIQRI